MQERAHAVPFVNLSNIFPLHQTYFKTTCSFMHDFVNDLAPLDISELFSYSSEKHHHYTRSSAAGNLCLKYSRTKHKKNYFSRLDARIWNSIPICLLLDLNMNLNGIPRQLLNILMREYTYVDVHNLTDKLRKLYHF